MDNYKFIQRQRQKTENTDHQTQQHTVQPPMIQRAVVIFDLFHSLKSTIPAL